MQFFKCVKLYTLNFLRIVIQTFQDLSLANLLYICFMTFLIVAVSNGNIEFIAGVQRRLKYNVDKIKHETTPTQYNKITKFKLNAYLLQFKEQIQRFYFNQVTLHVYYYNMHVDG